MSSAPFRRRVMLSWVRTGCLVSDLKAVAQTLPSFFHPSENTHTLAGLLWWTGSVALVEFNRSPSFCHRAFAVYFLDLVLDMPVMVSSSLLVAVGLVSVAFTRVIRAQNRMRRLSPLRFG